VSEALYERYKDALRRGHVAALRGRLEIALAAYDEAAAIAPERPLPHASRGGVLHRLGREDDALAAYAAALDRAPGDEAALGGRADVLAALGRRVAAADDLDRVAEVQEAAGRLTEACDSARRALELAESRARRRHVESLARRLREAPADDAAAAALERALGILEPARSVAPGGPGGAVPTDDRRADEEPSDVAAGAEAEPAVALPAVEPPPDPALLTAEAEACLDRADTPGARSRLLAAAAAYRAAGAPDAALDACYLALGIAPGDPDLHLALAELYLDRGWRGAAGEKLLLLDRLVGLTGDTDVRSRIAALVADRLPDDPRLASPTADRRDLATPGVTDAWGEASRA